MDFRRAFAVIGALVFAGLVAMPAYAQDQQRKLSNDEMREASALNDLVDAVAAGKQPAPADVQVEFHNYFLRSQDVVYIPYVLDISGGKFSSYPVAMYIRAVRNTDGAEAAKPGEWPYADAYFLTEKHFTAAESPDEVRVARALQLTPGEYTLYFALRERQPRDRNAARKTVVVSRPLSVPDLTKELTTSTLMLASSLEPNPEPLTPQQQIEQPFTISGYDIAPIFSSRVPQSGDLLFVFFIYNEGVGANGKPDLDVDYHFFRADEEQPFTKLATQSFNATTLPEQYDAKAGHQVFVGQGIPLKSDVMTFAPGDYRLEIKITDKTNGQTVTRNLPFTVVL